MTPDPPVENTPGADLATALALGHARHRGRPWGPSARALLASCGGPADPAGGTPAGAAVPRSPAAADAGERFLVVDDRYGTPIYVLLELDPTAEPGFPGLGVRAVTLELAAGPAGFGVPAGAAIGRDPGRLDRFRTFGSDRAVAGAGFILIEPRYVGPSWPGYVLAFRPDGERSGKRPGPGHPPGGDRR